MPKKKPYSRQNGYFYMYLFCRDLLKHFSSSHSAGVQQTVHLLGTAPVADVVTILVLLRCSNRYTTLQFFKMEVANLI